MTNKSEHCGDHCDLFADVAVIKQDVKYIKMKFEEKKTDLKWTFTTAIAIIAVVLKFVP